MAPVGQPDIRIQDRHSYTESSNTYLPSLRAGEKLVGIQNRWPLNGRDMPRSYGTHAQVATDLSKEM